MKDHIGTSFPRQKLHIRVDVALCLREYYSNGSRFPRGNFPHHKPGLPLLHCEVLCTYIPTDWNDVSTEREKLGGIKPGESPNRKAAYYSARCFVAVFKFDIRLITPPVSYKPLANWQRYCILKLSYLSAGCAVHLQLSILFRDTISIPG